MKTAGPWPWKPAPAKECVTAHRPNATALKMDGAQAGNPYTTASGNHHPLVSRKARGLSQILAVMPGETAPGADLGGSSKYSNENFED